MPKEDWHVGYKETKNLIHNEMKLSKEDVRDIFKEVAREEVQKLLVDNKAFIFSTMQDVIKREMELAVSEHRYPRIKANAIIWGHNYKGEANFKDYISGVIKEEIVNQVQNQFTVSLDIRKND